MTHESNYVLNILKVLIVHLMFGERLDKFDALIFIFWEWIYLCVVIDLSILQVLLIHCFALALGFFGICHFFISHLSLVYLSIVCG